MGRYSSGQRGQTVNLLCELRRFESCSPHKNFELDYFLKFTFRKSETQNFSKGSPLRIISSADNPQM